MGDFTKFLIWLQFVALVNEGQGQTYADATAIYTDRMNSDIYNPDVRPIKNQSRVLFVGVTFQILSVVDLDDVTESFNCNGFVVFVWTDEILQWNPEMYGGLTMIHPQAKNIWRPRVILGNTLDTRDIFEDDHAPVSIFSNGSSFWSPGSTFPTSCSLDMTKYPFDEQTCAIQLLSMGYTIQELQFFPVTNNVGTKYFIEGGEWQLVDTSINVMNVTENRINNYSAFEVKFRLRRNPNGILINILLPVVFLSFLNLWVFVIPVESGEKITYGISVLMALTVFMSIVSALVPKSSFSMPRVVIYIFILFIISLLTVLTSIVIVFLHHKEVCETQHQKAKMNLRNAITKVTRMRSVVGLHDPLTSAADKVVKLRQLSHERPSTEFCPEIPTKCVGNEIMSGRNRYKIVGKYIDLVSLIVFSTIWIFTTFGFLFEIAA